MPFLQILTRCFRRPRLLMANIAGLEAQTDADWEQTMLVDCEGIGVGPAQAMLANCAAFVRGAYLWVLDDDDMCIHSTLVEELKAIATEHDPDVVMVRMHHGPTLGILPDDAHWQLPPQLSHIGASAFIVRRDVWQRHAHAYASSRYTSDFDFINSIFVADPNVFWHDVIASRVQRRSYGNAE